MTAWVSREAIRPDARKKAMRSCAESQRGARPCALGSFGTRGFACERIFRSQAKRRKREMTVTFLWIDDGASSRAPSSRT